MSENPGRALYLTHWLELWMSQLLESSISDVTEKFLNSCEPANFDDLMYEVIGRDSVSGGLRFGHLASCAVGAGCNNTGWVTL